MHYPLQKDVQPNDSFLPVLESDCLHFVTCGSVDAGKSTLIGRLLFDSQLLCEDQIDTLQKDSEKYASNSLEKRALDYSLLLDGLQDEREQGITIDLAYRFFQISTRRFVVADAPGHERYTKNMATGASTSVLGVIVVDAEKGILPQTRRHTLILYLMGIRHFVLCINKMDSVSFSENVFKDISVDYDKILSTINENKNLSLRCIPVSAAQGDNVAHASDHMPWYKGGSLLSYLKNIHLKTEKASDFIMPVQLVSRLNSTFRGYMGTVLGGKVTTGEKIKILPNKQESKIKSIITGDGIKKEYALPGEAITLELENDVDIVRGDLIAKETAPLKIADHFQVNILCIDEEPLYPSRSYTFKFSHRTVNGIISRVNEKYNLESLRKEKTKILQMNEFGVCDIYLSQKIPFAPYDSNKPLGSFLIIDRILKKTIGVGMILFDLRRSHNIFPPQLKISKQLRSQAKKQKPCLLWFTGLSGAGKTTLANMVEEKLFDRGYHTYFIDGDSIRKGLSSDLGFSMGDRIENMRRMGYLSKYFVDAGIITLVAAVSPFQNERNNIRELFEPHEFIEIYVKASLETCMRRDPNKIYAKHKLGEVSFLTGVDSNSSYEFPINPEIIVDTEKANAETLANQIIKYVEDLQKNDK